jgi:hypothetical protein
VISENYEKLIFPLGILAFILSMAYIGGILIKEKQKQKESNDKYFQQSRFMREECLKSYSIDQCKFIFKGQ